MPSASTGEVTRLLRAWSAGHPRAQEELLALVYGDLRQRAAGHLRRDRRGHTLQPTALVHEAYVRLVGQRRVTWKNRSHFFALASRVMRRILVDHARARAASKRPDGALRVTLDNDLVSVEPRACDSADVGPGAVRAGRARPAPRQHRRAVLLRRPDRRGGCRGHVGLAFDGGARASQRESLALSPHDAARPPGIAVSEAARWKRVKEIFDAAAACRVEDRAAQVRELCGEDCALQEEVESLLAADAGKASILDHELGP